MVAHSSEALRTLFMLNAASSCPDNRITPIAGGSHPSVCRGTNERFWRRHARTQHHGPAPLPAPLRDRIRGTDRRTTAFNLLTGSGAVATTATSAAESLPFVDGYSTNVIANSTPETNAAVRILLNSPQGTPPGSR
jgi:hypothetical protein